MSENYGLMDHGDGDPRDLFFGNRYGTGRNGQFPAHPRNRSSDPPENWDLSAESVRTALIQKGPHSGSSHESAAFTKMPIDQTTSLAGDISTK